VLFIITLFLFLHVVKSSGTTCTRDVESLKAFVLDEAKKAAEKAQLDSHEEL
jgi:hypothetical protein